MFTPINDSETIVPPLIVSVPDAKLWTVALLLVPLLLAELKYAVPVIKTIPWSLYNACFPPVAVIKILPPLIVMFPVDWLLIVAVCVDDDVNIPFEILTVPEFSRSVPVVILIVKFWKSKLIFWFCATTKFSLTFCSNLTFVSVLVVGTAFIASCKEV